MDSSQQTILAPDREWISIKTASFRVARSEKTIRRWCAEYRIFRQVSRWAPIEVHVPALLMVKNGDLLALELLRAGERRDPRVLRYLAHLGFEP